MNDKRSISLFMFPIRVEKIVEGKEPFEMIARCPDIPVLLSTATTSFSFSNLPDLINAVALSLLMACVGVMIVKITKRYASRTNQDEEKALEAFEKEMTQECSIKPKEHIPQKTPSPIHGKSSPRKKMETLEDVVARLREAHIFKSNEGTAHLPGEKTTGRVITLTDGTTALISPQILSPSTLAHQIKKYDYVFQILDSGDVLVSERYSSLSVVISLPICEKRARSRFVYFSCKITYQYYYTARNF